MKEKEKYIYLAGLFDGEGCFSISLDADKKNWRGIKTFHIEITIVNTDLKILKFIQNLLKRGIITSKKVNLNRKPVYHLRFYKLSDCLRICKILYPYLKIKRKQCELMKKWCISRLSQKYPKILLRDNKGRILKKEDSGYSEKEINIYYQLKKLNQRGQEQVAKAERLIKAGKNPEKRKNYEQTD